MRNFRPLLTLMELALCLGFALCLSPSVAADRAPLATSVGAQQAPASSAPAAQAPAATPQQETAKKVTAYTLPPDRYKKARDHSRIGFRLALINFVYGLVVLWLILRWKLSAKYRTWAESAASKRFLQALVFSPLLILTMDTLELPTGVYANWVERKYGLSVQGWGSWAWDWIKGELIGIVVATILIWILYSVIRKSPRRWWFYFWLASLPIGLFLFFLTPLVIDPLFHKFEPLAQKDPALTASLEQMVQHAGKNIPPERMFWMGAGEKTTALDAYVTGVGASKRIVVFDTTIAKMSTPQIVFVAGHEMGHYVLNHLPKGLAFFAALLLVFFYLGFRTIGWVLARWGGNWGIRGLDDWASLPALLLLLSIFFFVANPIASAFSRYLEHQADQYGLEVTHGLTPDSGQVGAQAFQVLGDVDLADPERNPVEVFLFYSHPSIPDRVQFALTYDPWSKGEQPEFVK
jgi:STE24 endopeptidase